MTEFFLKIVNMSISASWLVLAVLALRLGLRKAPKWIHVLLWGIVAVRLVCPFSIESALSLIPSTQTISLDIMTDKTPEISTGIQAVNRVVNPVITQSFAPDPGTSANPLQILIPAASVLWLAGVALMALYTAVSYFRLAHRVCGAVRLRDNIYQTDTIPSPFVLGLFRPRIYLPGGMEEGALTHVIAHEQTHIRRRDHWWKPLGFALLTVHWFNPLMWAAYILLCRDIELACDEKVIKELGRDQRADYSQALLRCSVDRRSIAACPLAFGEVGVKARIRNVLSYQKPAFWVVVLAVVLSAAVAVCFLTDPSPSRRFSMAGTNVADLDPDRITGAIAEMEDLEDGSQLCTNANNFDIHLTSDFQWDDSQTIRFFYQDGKQDRAAQLRIFPAEDEFFVTEAQAWPAQDSVYKLRHYLAALKYLPQAAIRELCPDADGYILRQVEEGAPEDYDRVITYAPEGPMDPGSWLIHLELQPMHETGSAYTGSGTEVVHLFFGQEGENAASPVTAWVDRRAMEAYVDEPVEATRAEFPGVTFRYEIGAVYVVKDGEETTLFQGMPVWNAYFADLTGDRKPEICATVSYGSGLVDTHVVVYDYAAGQEYTLWNRGVTDYALSMEDGRLLCEAYSFVNGGIYQGELLASSELRLAEAGGGSGRKLIIDAQARKDSAIVRIVDRTVTEQLPTAEALEYFYEDENFLYYFASIRSHYVMVHYSDGSSEDIRSALEAGRAAIADLNTFGIHFYVEPRQSAMVPAQINLEGFYAEYLFVPMDGASYRYSLTEADPAGITADELLLEFSQDTAVEGVAWQVYSLKEHPDRTKLLLVSGTQAAWLCEYAPAAKAEEGALEAARAEGLVIVEDGRLTGGREQWLNFYEAVQAGRHASVKVAHYYTLDPGTTAPTTYQVYQEDYPSLYVHVLTYDGDTFVLRTEEDVRVFEYLMRYTDADPYDTVYVLTHDRSHTWAQLWQSLFSSAAGAAIDQYTICAE